MAGKNQHAHVRQLFAHAAKQIDAVQPGEFCVEDKKVGLDLETKGLGALAIAALAHELVIDVQAKNFSEHLANGGLVFNDYKPFHRE